MVCKMMFLFQGWPEFSGSMFIFWGVRLRIMGCQVTGGDWRSNFRTPTKEESQTNIKPSFWEGPMILRVGFFFLPNPPLNATTKTLESRHGCSSCLGDAVLAAWDRLLLIVRKSCNSWCTSQVVNDLLNRFYPANGFSANVINRFYRKFLPSTVLPMFLLFGGGGVL